MERILSLFYKKVIALHSQMVANCRHVILPIHFHFPSQTPYKPRRHSLFPDLKVWPNLPALVSAKKELEENKVYYLKK